MKLRYLIPTVLFVLMQFAYASATPATKPPKFSGDPNRAILVKADNPTVRLTLKSNRTTGFSWYVMKYNQNLVTPISEKYMAPNSNLAGAPGYSVWTFKIAAQAFTMPHLLQISMVYARPWEMGDLKPTVFKVITERSGSN